MKISTVTLALISAALIAGCATTESSRTIEAPAIKTSQTPYHGVRTAISIGKFDNRSNYMRGVFSDGQDRLGSQAKTILTTHLQQTGRFRMLDRENLSETAQEVAYSNGAQKIIGARYVVTGDVTEFGRKVTGDRQFFGVLGRGKSQVAYAKVNLNIVDVETSEVVFSSQGAGEYALSNREVVGFGSTAGYDATLNGKVLDLAIREAVDHLVEGISRGRWQPVN